MNVLLLSTYELGHQPFGLAEPAAVLREAGASVRCLDLAVQCLDEDLARGADLIAFYLPMHTATRLAVAALPRVRALNPTAHLCFYGLYAPLNEAYLRALGAGTVLGGEFELGLRSLAQRLLRGPVEEQLEPTVYTGAQTYLVPDRSDLPELGRYAALHGADGSVRSAGYVEASRGCKHQCRHCPVVPVYRGRFRAVPREVVLADIRQQVSAGAGHISFGDPDFFNGPSHALRIVRALHEEHPSLTYDVTIKIEHLIERAELLPVLRETGCLFVTTAVESVEDRVLERLAKGHTRADFERVVAIFRELGLTLAPTFVAFTPWTTVAGYQELLRALVELELVDAVSPVQLTIRLLIPPGSRLLELAEVRALVGPLDREALVHPWRHPDPDVDALAEELARIVEDGEARGLGRTDLFRELWTAADRAAGQGVPSLELPAHGIEPPRLSEPWYCCAEPTRHQLEAF